MSQHKEKLFVTFPYPDMNRRLHIGHGFDLADSGDDMFDLSTARSIGSKLDNKIVRILEFQGQKNLQCCPYHRSHLISIQKYGRTRDYQIKDYRNGEYNTLDTLFDQQINWCVKNTIDGYEINHFKKVWHWAFNELERMYKNYEKWSSPEMRKHFDRLGMHRDIVMKYIQVQTHLLAPIVPDYCNCVWEVFPVASPMDFSAEYDQSVIDKGIFWDRVWSDIHHQIKFKKKIKKKIKKNDGGDKIHIRVEFVRNAPSWYSVVNNIMRTDQPKRDKIKNVSRVINQQKINKKTKKKIIGSIVKDGCLDLTNYAFKDVEYEDMMCLFGHSIYNNGTDNDIVMVYQILDIRDDMLPNNAKVTTISQ